MILKTITISLVMSAVLLADCTSQLAVCDKYVKVLKEENTVLYDLNTTYKRERDEAIKKAQDNVSSPLIPWYVYGLIGFAGGVVLGAQLSK